MVKSIAVCALIFTTQLSFAAENPPTLEIKKFEVSPKIDGEIEPAWLGAAHVDGFFQVDPKEGEPATEKTEVYMGYDDKYLYAAFHAYDSEPDKIYSSLVKRDTFANNDYVSLRISTFNDRRLAYVFACNPSSVQFDYFMTAKDWSGETSDVSFDAVWKCAAKRISDGYLVEMAIPFKSLRFPKSQIQTWAVMLKRLIPRKSEGDVWPQVSSSKGLHLHQMADLKGIEGILPSLQLEVVPEASATKTLGQDWKSTQGINLRYGPTSNSSIDFTYNPDFSQIELDDVRLLTNLRYPVKIAEKRPFFMERADIFATPITAIHTRTIVDPLWGGKVTGKFSKANVGVLVAQDEVQKEKADVIAGRANFDVGKKNTIGGVFTSREQADDYNRVGGI
ncbi:MAG: DUF5916 domain-containing protein, partial [Elusimicrobia bacterium]|nr:DUF5916 domain-containing protein [Elusimicrobiota bacterium]